MGGNRFTDLMTPGPGEQGLTRKNLRRGGLRLADVDSATCAALERLYRSHNERLYEFLARGGQAPEDEPVFPHFRHPCASRRSTNKTIH